MDNFDQQNKIETEIKNKLYSFNIDKFAKEAQIPNQNFKYALTALGVKLTEAVENQSPDEFGYIDVQLKDLWPEINQNNYFTLDANGNILFDKTNTMLDYERYFSTSTRDESFYMMVQKVMQAYGNNISYFDNEEQWREYNNIKPKQDNTNLTLDDMETVILNEYFKNKKIKYNNLKQQLKEILIPYSNEDEIKTMYIKIKELCDDARLKKGSRGFYVSIPTKSVYYKKNELMDLLKKEYKKNKIAFDIKPAKDNIIIYFMDNLLKQEKIYTQFENDNGDIIVEIFNTWDEIDEYNKDKKYKIKHTEEI